MNESATAFDVFKKNYTELEECYNIFFPSLKKFAAHYLDSLLLA
jgi:acyl carrier protein phosphodiesterase